MSEETKQVEENATTESTDPIAPDQIRSHKLFKQVCAETKELREKLQALEGKEQEEQAKRQRAELESKGEYEQILAQKEAEIESIRKAHSDKILEMEINNRLLKNGANNDLFIKGAIASYDGDLEGISDYVGSLVSAESNAHIFGVNDKSSAQKGTQKVTPGSRATTDWAQVKADLSSPQKASGAARLLETYIRDHGGETPPGF